MCAPLAAAAAITAISGGYSAYNQYQQGASQDKYYQLMAQNANTEAGYARASGEQALRQGDAQSKIIQDQAAVQGKQLKTSQAEQNASTRAALAANGVYGVSAQDIVSNNLSKEQMDEVLLRHNADLNSYEAKTNAAFKNQAYQYDAWQSNVQGDQLRYQGKTAAYAGKVGAFSTLLSTAASVASMKYGSTGK